MTLYLITAGLWSIYAMKQQKRLYDENVLITGIINFIICPLAIISAISRFEEQK